MTRTTRCLHCGRTNWVGSECCCREVPLRFPPLRRPRRNVLAVIAIAVWAIAVAAVIGWAVWGVVR